MTFGQIRAEVFRRLEEVASAPVFWTEDDVDAAILAAYAEVSDETEWYEVALTVTKCHTRPWYDARKVLGDRFLRLGPAFNTETNRWLMPSAQGELDVRDVRWERVTGEGERVLTQGLWWFSYWPRFAGDTGTVRQLFTALPDDLSDDEDEPGYPEPFHYGLVEDALADLWAQDGEGALAVAAWEAGRTYEAGLTAFVQGRASVPMGRGFRG